MSTFSIETAHPCAQHASERKDHDEAFSGDDYRGFRLSLKDIICSWAISVAVVVLTFTIFG